MTSVYQPAHRASLVRRRGTPEEMAKATLFLASSDSADCVGAELMLGFREQK